MVKLLKTKKRKIVPSDTGRARTPYPPSEASCEAGAMRGAAPFGRARTPCEPRKIVLVGTYAGDQLMEWPGYYPYPLSTDDKIDAASAKKVNEIWLFKGTKEPRYFAAECLGVKTREELKTLGYPAKGAGHGDGTYLLFKIEKTYAPANASAELAASVESVIIRTKDFAKRSPKVAKQLKAYLESPDRNDAALANQLPSIVTKLPPQVLRVCDGGACLSVWSPVKGVTPQLEKIESIVMSIATFGRNREMPVAKAYDYLCAHAGMNFLDEHYSITRCYSDEMMDESLSKVCRNHGGTVK